MTGNPRCHACHGKGIIKTQHGYAKCGCVSGTKDQRAAQRHHNSIGTTFNLDQFRSTKDGSDGRR